MEQTNRTILFEVLNPQLPSLFNLAEEEKQKKSLTDERIALIHDTLEVNSFLELQQKFKPCIYMMLNTSKWDAFFSCQPVPREDYEQSVICLDDKNSMLSVLLTLMDSKKQGKYLLKNFNDILKALIPKERKREFLQQRKELLENFKRGNHTQAKEQCEHILQQKEGIFFLQLFLQEACRILLHQEVCEKKNRFITDNEITELVTPVAMSENLKQQVVPYTKEERTKYDAFLKECIQELEEQKGKTLPNKDLLYHCLSLPLLQEKEELVTVQCFYEKALDYYTHIIKGFWVQAKPLLEQLLGIKMFFEQYGDTKDGRKPSLVIANFPVKDILNLENQRRLKLYLESVNHKNDGGNVLWYGILPHIAQKESTTGAEPRKRFAGTEEILVSPVNEPMEVTVLLNILASYRIQTFVSAGVDEKTTFSWLSHHGLEHWNQSLQQYSQVEALEYVIPCYPNCMVIPKEHAQLRIGQSTFYDQLQDEICLKGERKLWLSGIGVEASYIVAGLFAACQCPVYLKERYAKDIDSELPGVAYSIMDNGHYMITATTMAREVLNFPKEQLQEIQRKGVGVVLVPIQGKIVVCTDRTLAYLKGINDEIHHIQTVNYIQRVIRYVTQDYKEHLIRQFFQNRAGNTKMHWMENRKSINSILKEGETLTYELDEKNHTCTFTVTFEKNRKGETVKIAK